MTELEKLASYNQEDLDKAFKKYWNKQSLNCSRQEKPSLNIIGGQPGVGKSSARKQILQKIDYNRIEIDYDELRQFHPNAKEIYLKGADRSDDYSTHTKKFIKELGDKIIEKAIENNYNVVIEKTMNSTKNMKELIDRFKGYDLNISIVTTRGRNSKVSTIQRYKDAKDDFDKGKSNMIPRFISQAYQEKCIKNLPHVAQNIADKYKDEKKLKDFKVYYRNETFQQKKIFDIKSHDVRQIRDTISLATQDKSKSLLRSKER